MKKSNGDNMTAKPKSIVGVFNDNDKLKIPIFQRDYSWKKDNWEELWNDIKIGFDNNNKHYLGSVVLVGQDKYKEVIDGQQRLTTISIIYLAIISNFNELIEKKIDIENNSKRVQDMRGIICETNLYDFTSTNKLELNENNNLIYSDYLVNNKVPENYLELNQSNKLLVDCFNFFKRRIKKECTITGEANQNVKLMLDYYKYINENLIIIEIVATDYENAYVIFETLNDRGLDLTVTDLLKNYLFSKIDISKHTNIKKHWNDIISNVEEKNTTKFIRHYWNSFNNKVTEKELFKEIKNKIITETDTTKFLEDLDKASRIYSALSDPKNKIWAGDTDIVRYLEEIKMYKVELCYPVLLAAQSCITNLKLKRKIFRLCSIISFRYIFISNGSANDLEKAYNDLCLKINKYKNEIKIELIQKDMKEFLVSKEEFIAKFNNKEIKTRNNKKVITYILKGIERNIGTKINEDHTIEHILPESYTDEWNKKFNNEAQQYIYRLGNYILLEKEYNSEIGNSEFSDKKPRYKESVYNEAKKISELEDWGIEQLENHQYEMAKIANTVWSF